MHVGPFAVGVPDAANPTPNPTLTLTLTPSINPDPNPNPNPTRRLLTAATYCGYLLRLLTSACALSATGGVPYLSLTSSWCLIVHQLAYCTGLASPLVSVRGIGEQPSRRTCSECEKRKARRRASSVAIQGNRMSPQALH